MTLPSSECILTVRHPDCPFTFKVSFMWDYYRTLMGVEHYKIGAKRPPRKSHMLLTDSVRNWISELEPVAP